MRPALSDQHGPQHIHLHCLGRAEFVGSEGTAMTSWKPIEDAPKDGRSVLLWARLASAPAERDDFSFPVVGFWHIAFERWKVAPALLGEKGLIPTYWTDLPPEPDMSA